ncbi:hypothetical protein [Rickettsia felis]|uniref:hypothetical protein n=1 Tax=Rickettsia felis TaxID=42862 RepID=UPI000A4E9F4F|nr:hypothetical protein [Rickettsia felis]
MDQFFRHCEKNYVVIRRSNPVKNSDLQNFFYCFSELQQCFAPRNDDLTSMRAIPIFKINNHIDLFRVLLRIILEQLRLFRSFKTPLEMVSIIHKNTILGFVTVGGILAIQ